MHPKILALTVAASLLPAALTVAQSTIHSVPLPAKTSPAAPQAPSAAALQWVQSNIAKWPEGTRRLAAQLITTYGPPAEHSARRLAWYDNAPWKRTTLYREGPRHNFANAHQDILEQTVSYKVPPEKFTELAQFNGSVIADRTRGELTAVSDAEDTNFLALNVAYDIIRGDRTVEQARTYFAQMVRAKMIGEPERALQGLKFTPASAADAADPDELAPLIRHMNDSE